MDISSQTSGSTITVQLAGKLNFKDHQSFNAFLDTLDKSATHVIFNVQNLEQIDSAGIGMLFLAQTVIERNNAKISIKGPQGQVKRIFDITSLDKQIEILNS